jgi:hypothetical protein
MRCIGQELAREVVDLASLACPLVSLSASLWLLVWKNVDCRSSLSGHSSADRRNTQNWHVRLYGPSDLPVWFSHHFPLLQVTYMMLHMLFYVVIILFQGHSATGSLSMRQA